ncbi:holo-[acyl-carrier-protein] synthase [Phytophthora boehmeriae]|uniref:Holo-[acyl-carrier-protein] synthase n=1 Tax=Phytophthora boehmeriae TaxID=109152 RepID=A0A8T1WH33_9STRA|nr:holo-[acyl-carrier-protein] synthase [Phytophthora boehmeriae]
MATLRFLLLLVLHFLTTTSTLSEASTLPVANSGYIETVSMNIDRTLTVAASNVSVDKKDLPIFFFHGLTSSSADGANFAANITAEGRAFVALSFCENECSIQALNRQVPMAIAAVRDVAASDERFDNGYIFMGHSMGGILARAVIEEMDDHQVHTFVSLAGALSGIFYGPQDADQIPLQFLAQGSASTAIPPTVFDFSNYSTDGYRGKMQDDWARKLTDPEVQATYSFANVARFPVRDVWSNTNEFVPVYNNVNPCASNDTNCQEEKYRRKGNFLKVKEAHLFASPEDGVGAPWQMGHFGYYSEVETLGEIETKFENLSIVEMHDTVEYKGDTFGLRTLDERGGLFLHTVRNVSHPCWLYDYSYLHTEGTCAFKPVYDEYVYKVIS